MNFPQAIRYGFINYATFNGRAPRSAYWYWLLFCLLGSVACTILDNVLFHPPIDSHALYPLKSIFSLLTFLPTIGMAVRRLHDIDRSGWWEWLLLLPLIGWIILVIWKCQKGTNGSNRFGTDPLVTLLPS